jgi:serine protease Do
MKLNPLAGVLLLLLGSIAAPAALRAQPATPVALDAPPATARVLAARAPQNADDLRRIQDQLQKVVRRVLPATVAVEIPLGSGRRTGYYSGSGVVVSKEGLILTAAHVIGRPGRKASVEFPDGTRLTGRTLGANHDDDAGMIQLDNPPKNLPFVPWNKAGHITSGEWVVTIGQPGGIIEGRAPPVRFGRVLFHSNELLCTDCKLVGGDSGGPLFNMEGEVIGIHSSIGPMITHNFHVPITVFNDGWDRLLKGEVWGTEYDDELDSGRPLLGVAGKTEESRCLIAQVYPGMPGEKAGVKAGDVIVEVNGRQIDGFDDLARIVASHKPGDKMKLTIDRTGETLELTAELVGVE